MRSNEDYLLTILLTKRGSRIFSEFFRYVVHFSSLDIDRLMEKWNSSPDDETTWSVVAKLAYDDIQECNDILFEEINDSVTEIDIVLANPKCPYPRKRLGRLAMMLVCMTEFKSESLVPSLSLVYQELVCGKNGTADSKSRKAYLFLAPLICEISMKMEVQQAKVRRKSDFPLSILLGMLYQPEELISTLAFISLSRIFLQFPRRRRRLGPVAHAMLRILTTLAPHSNYLWQVREQ